jgi:hypothetical protein
MMSNPPKYLTDWYKAAINEGRMPGAKTGFIYILFDRTDLSDEQIKQLPKEEFIQRLRYIGQSKNKVGDRPLHHFSEAIKEVDSSDFVSFY